MAGTPPPFVLTYIVAQGQSVGFSDPWASSNLYQAGYVLQLGTVERIAFEDDGNITVTDGPDGAAANVYGIVDLNIPDPTTRTFFPAGSTVTIGPSGSLSVTGSTPAGQVNPAVYGFYSAMGFASLENDGQITVSNQGTGAAYGAALGIIRPNTPVAAGGGTLLNGATGTITVTASSGAGVEVGPNAGNTSGGISGGLVNVGSIVAHGGAWGVQAGGGNAIGQVFITNSGSITAFGGASASTGIGSAPGLVVSVDITNSGVITADNAIHMFAGTSFIGTLTPALNLHNSGTLNGNVLTDPSSNMVAGQDSVINTGAIHGDVQLLSTSANLYDGRGGVLSGALTISGFTNTVYLGNDGETVTFDNGPYGYLAKNVVTDGTGADHVTGGVGNDIVYATGGGDVFDGGGGSNLLDFQRATAGITVDLGVTTAQNTGGAGIETISNFQALTGTVFADHLIGDAADSFINGGGGADIIDGGAGNETIRGGAANDTIHGGGGNDIIDGGGGDDVIDGGSGTNTIVYASATAGVHVSLALQGAAQDTGAGHQTLSNFQNITGSAFSDTLTGDSGDNLIDGGPGGGDVLDGGGGVNTISFQSSTSGVTVSLGASPSIAIVGQSLDILSNFRNILGSNYDDQLTGDSGDNIIDGGAGFNTVSYALATGDVTVNLVTGTASGAGVGHDTLTRIQGVIGSDYFDTFVGPVTGRYDGRGGFNTLDISNETAGVTVNFAAGSMEQDLPGGAVRSGYVTNIQKLIATNYDDTVIFGAGNRVVTGGLGADTFVMSPGAGNDFITDFTHGDKIDLSAFQNFQSLQDVQKAAYGGPEAYFALPGGGSLTVENVPLSSLTAGDFIFARPVTRTSADFTGDHRADIIFRNPVTGDWGYAAMTASGYDWHHFGNSTAAYAVGGIGDFNGDGTPDVIFRDPSTGDWGYAQMFANGSGYTWVHLGTSGAAYDVAATGDFNADGRTDALFRDPSTGDWGYAAMTAAGYNWVHLGNSGAAYAVAGSGDFNGDGRADVLFRDPSTGDWGYAAMTAQGFDWHHFGNSGVNYAVAGTGDFNGDGYTDVLFRDPSTGDWGYAAMNPQGYTWVHLGNSGVDYTVAGTGDFNGDGRTDVIFRDAFTGDWGYAAMTVAGYNWVHIGVSSTDYLIS
jgi:Ca2+-binding RTX toxin-like protein